jgi:hypothetical protein
LAYLAYVTTVTTDSLKWLFDGVGAAVLVAIGSTVWRQYSKNIPMTKSRADTTATVVKAFHNNTAALRLEKEATVSAPIIVGSNNITTHNVTNAATQPEHIPIRQRKASHPTPVEIHDAVKKSPPFQQDECWSHFIGLKVEWPVEYYNVRHQGSRTDYCVNLIFRENHQQMTVRCTVNIDDYPILKIVGRNHLVWIRGEIELLDDVIIMLRDATLEFE